MNAFLVKLFLTAVFVWASTKRDVFADWYIASLGLNGIKEVLMRAIARLVRVLICLALLLATMSLAGQILA